MVDSIQPGDSNSPLYQAQGPEKVSSSAPKSVGPNASEDSIREWIEKYVEAWTDKEGKLQARVKFNPEDQTCSEAVAYAMRLLADHPNMNHLTTLGSGQYSPIRELNSQQLFDGLNNFVKDTSLYGHHGLMPWLINGDGSINDTGSATDADCDLASALIQASNSWGGQYGHEAKEMIQNIKKYDCYNGGNTDFKNIPKEYQWSGPMLGAGNNWGEDDTPKFFNASYVDPFIFNTFKNFTGDNFWDDLSKNCLTVIAGTQAEAKSGLMPDWCDPRSFGKTEPPFENRYFYGYDACRTPFRLAAYLDLSPTPNSEIAKKLTSILTKFMDFVVDHTKGNPGLFPEGYNMDGTPREDWWGPQNPAFDGPVAVALSILLRHNIYPPLGSPVSYKECVELTKKLAQNVIDYLGKGIPDSSEYDGYYASILALLSMDFYDSPTAKGGTDKAKERMPFLP